ncbi:hypothetical protein [Pontibacter chitinilyticus]|uniref:hypothetical protein n=1 Tax=Pontibacter chitinilyticus TaxID=2674989 RepID=UPI003219EB00
MINFETEYLNIWINEEVNLLYSEWLQPITGEGYRQEIEKLTTLLQAHTLKCGIADWSRLGDILPEDQRWTLQKVLPDIVASGVSKLARVSGEDRVSFNKFKDFMEKASFAGLGNVDIRQFMSYKEAADWVGEFRYNFFFFRAHPHFN